MIEAILTHIGKYLVSFYPLFDLKRLKNKNVGVVVSAYHGGVDMLINSLTAFYYFLGPLPLVIYQDGTLTAKDKTKLRKHFNVSPENETKTILKLKKLLRGKANILNFRFNSDNQLNRCKLDPLLLSPFKKTIYLEADVLFFSKAKEVISWIESENSKNLYMEHARSFFSSDKRRDLDYSFRLFVNNDYFRLRSPSFNSGILCFDNKVFKNLDKLEKVYRLFNETFYSRCPCAEEVATSTLFTKLNSKALPQLKFVCPAVNSEYKQIAKRRNVCIHYIWQTKVFYWKDAIKLCMRSKLFRNKN